MGTHENEFTEKLKQFFKNIYRKGNVNVCLRPLFRQYQRFILSMTKDSAGSSRLFVIYYF